MKEYDMELKAKFEQVGIKLTMDENNGLAPAGAMMFRHAGVLGWTVIELSAHDFAELRRFMNYAADLFERFKNDFDHENDSSASS